MWAGQARSGPLRENADLKKAYATPIIVKQGDRDVLVSPGADWLYGYDPKTGAELWRMSYGELGFSVVPRPVTGHGLIYMSTSFNQPRLLAVKLAADGRGAAIAWEEKKGAPSMPSPLVVGERLCMVSDKGVATFLDANVPVAPLVSSVTVSPPCTPTRVEPVTYRVAAVPPS